MVGEYRLIDNDNALCRVYSTDSLPEIDSDYRVGRNKRIIFKYFSS